MFLFFLTIATWIISYCPLGVHPSGYAKSWDFRNTGYMIWLAGGTITLQSYENMKPVPLTAAANGAATSSFRKAVKIGGDLGVRWSYDVVVQRSYDGVLGSQTFGDVYSGELHLAWLLLISLPLTLRGAGPILQSYYAKQMQRGVCRQCGYDLRATPGRCPECGTVADRQDSLAKH